ncbi:MAG: hypothetical protein ACRC4W_04390, partial [Treponemataceae bacterium]
LQIPVDKITFLADESEKAHFASKDFCGSISIMTQLILKCCTTIKKSRFMEALPICKKKYFVLPKKNQWDQQTLTGSPFYSMWWGVCVVVSEIDFTLFQPQVKKVSLFIDAGKILDKDAALLSVRRSAEQILSSLTTIDVMDFPCIEIDFFDSGENPKEIGELLSFILPAAFTSSISQIIGQAVISLPLDPALIYNAIENNGGQK